MSMTPYDGSEIAIVGMACRLPGADDPESFWRNLVDGVESIRRLSDEELLAAGVDSAELRDPRYVPAASVLDDVEGFDAGFFGYNAAEAKIMDPQQRVFLECCWEALEHAGYAAPHLRGPVGVYAGSKTNTYLFHLASDRALVGSMDFLQLVLGGDQAMLATRAAYKMDLDGPAYSVQSACSSSLLSVHLACQSLLLGECRMALAGGVAIHVPHRVGYRHQEGGILSPDGHCRAFDAGAGGTVFGSGAGVVVVKRLEDARADGDHVYALIRGSAVNNDGAEKASFTAPSVEGQTQVILEALAVSGVEADSISYVEAHGTGTPLGDPIEVLALTQAYRASTDRSGYCAIGSVKTNLGHLDAAAGITSLMKTALALDREVLPPSLHYREPNPGIDFASSPFFVNAQRTAWPRGDAGPRRAAVSSFGFGGTNTHMILEEAPAPEPAEPSPRDAHLLLLSARTEAALETATDRLAACLEEHTELEPADAAFTLQVGRRRFGHRRFAVVGSREEAVRALRERDADLGDRGETDGAARSLAFLFPGQGTQYPAMAAGLYDTEPAFREELDRVAELARPLMGLDLREVWRGQGEEAGERLRETGLTQPVVFAVEYALARLLESWGLAPRAMIGHSIGEVVAATLAGVFSLEDAVRLVVERGRLMQELPAGAMAAVSLPEAELAERLGPELSLAAVNGPRDCVVSGETAAVDDLLERLEAEGARCRRLHTSHAFHSAMMEPILDAFRRVVGSVDLAAPSIPVASNVTGAWLTAEQARDPEYWVRHLRGTVRFADGLATVLGEPSRALVEVGPGTSLATLARRHPGRGEGRPIVSTLRHPKDSRSDTAFLWSAIGRLWLGGVEPDWTLVYAGQRRRRVALPTYPFEHRRHWIDVAAPAAPKPPRLTLDKEADPADWGYRPAWRRREAPAELGERSLDGQTWLLLGGAEELTRELAAELSRRGARVAVAEAGEKYARPDGDRFTVRPDAVEDYGRLFSALDGEGRPPATIVHLWSRAPEAADEEGHQEAQRRGFFALTALAKALGRLQTPREERTVAVVTAPVHAVTGGETLVPDHAPVLGPVRVVPKEIPGWRWRHVDLDLPEAGGPEAGAIAPRLAAELVAGSPEAIVAYRGGERWAEGFERARVEAPEGEPGFVPEGVYLVTGGLGGVGFAVAHELAAACRARLVLVGRTELPPRERWDEVVGQAAAGDGVAERIGKIRRLEALGARVRAPAGDVADRRRMAEIVEETLETFGALDGVVHAAGIAGGGLVQLKSAEAAAAVLRPKVDGLRALAAALGDRVPPGRILLFSSLQSVLGDFGQVDYTAANAYLDAWAEAARRRGLPVTSIGWDNWRDVGIAAGTELPAHLEPWREELLAAALAVDEGVELLRRLWSRAEPRWVISTQDLAGRREMAESFTGGKILGELGGAGPERPGAAGEAARAAVPARVTGSSKELERRIAAVWERVLEVEGIGLKDNFFDLGGNSLSGMQLVSELSAELGVELSPVQLFESPSIAGLVERLRPDAGEAAEPARRKARRQREDDVAVIGMAGRFPGADGVEALWANLLAGTESIRFFTEDELRGMGVSEEQLGDPDYVPACPVLDGADRFDAELFGYSPRDARIMDPQHRVFLETVWTALEDAGYDSLRVPGPVGVFAGSSISSYLRNLYADPELMREVGELQALLGNEKDSLTTRVSYKLNLQGPSLAVQTFCSTSLVAVHLACRNLLDGECDMAIAGGVSIHFPQAGYLYDPSGGVSKDGHLRAFDAGASGYVFGNGAGAVVLKRLSDAMADGDPIRAVIKGSAVNNDGAVKAGFTATAVEGQARVAAAALAEAGVEPGTIGYVETHGSATPLGDPVEIAALGRVLGNGTPARCPVGSIKTNIGHLDRASGVAGLIKAILTLENGRIPRSLHFETPNPNIDFASSPFYVATEEIAWPRGDVPRRAAVNSLGLGGTNAHVVLEEAPARDPSDEPRPWHLLPLSAKTPSALAAVGERLAEHLEASGDDPRELADVAYTLAVGRRALENRRILVCRDAAEARRQLAGESPKRVFEAEHRDVGEPPVVFLFPGLGSHYVGMGRDLYRHEPAFRQAVDECAEILEPLLGTDLRTLLYPPEAETDGAAEGGVDLRRMLGRASLTGGDDHGTGPLAETRLAQPAVFVVEYALARLWTSWGVVPTACLGYSVGEYVAACVAGVYGLEDALKLVARRAELIQELPAGAMLGVPLTEAELEERLSGDVWLAAVNGPSQSVVAGPVEAVEALERELADQGTGARRLSTTHAFHTPMLTPVADALTALAAELTPREPRIPYLSNVTGTWVTLEDLRDPQYWARHMCRPVRFADAVARLTADPDRLYLEVGPGQTLSSLILQGAAGGDAPPRTVASLRHVYEREPDRATVLTALGKLWLLGVEVDWAGLYHGERRLRVRLPTYPFERRSFWVEPAAAPALAAAASAGGPLHLPSWRRSPAGASLAGRPELAGRRYLVFSDEDGSGVVPAVARALEQAGAETVLVRPGERFEHGSGGFVIDPCSAADHVRLLEALGEAPAGVVHGWGLGERAAGRRGFGSLSALAEALGERGGGEVVPVRVWALVEGVHAVVGDERLVPERAAALGPGQVFALTAPGSVFRAVDVVVPEGERKRHRLAGQIVREIAAEAPEQVVALRGAQRWVPELESLSAGDVGKIPAYRRDGGVYLVLDGAGSRGLPFARRLAALPGARLAVTVPEGAAEVPAALREVAGEVLVLAGVSAAEAAERVRERWGEIHGVVYAGPPARQGGGVGEVARDLAGLDDALARSAGGLDFALLVAALGTSGDGDLAGEFAVNLFFDAFAEARDDHRVGSWASVNWDLSDDDGAAFPEDDPFRRLPSLARSFPRVLVSRRNLARQWNRVAAHEPGTAPAERHPRPRLKVEFVEPRTDTERTIAHVWQDLLGLERVGVHDDFLELGGDSLLASRLTTRLRQALGLELPVRLFFEASTVEELGQAVEDLRREHQEARMARLLDELEGLSDDEVRLRLEREQLSAN